MLLNDGDQAHSRRPGGEMSVLDVRWMVRDALDNGSGREGDQSLIRSVADRTGRSLTRLSNSPIHLMPV